jgi:hypothetical protein
MTAASLPVRDQCGTNYGYKLHVDNGEEPCKPCRDGHRKYTNEYRSDPAVAAVAAWYTRTRAKALQQLAREYPARFLEILDELREADPKPVGEDRRRKAAA